MREIADLKRPRQDRLRTERVESVLHHGIIAVGGYNGIAGELLSKRSDDLLAFRIIGHPFGLRADKVDMTIRPFQEVGVKSLKIKSIFCPLSAISVMAFKAIDSSAPIARAPKYMTPR